MDVRPIHNEAWRRSSYSADGASCIEVARNSLGSTNKKLDYWTFVMFHDIIVSWTEKARSGFRAGHCRKPGRWLSQPSRVECIRKM